MGSAAFLIILTVAAVALVGYPLFTKRPSRLGGRASVQANQNRLVALLARKQAVYDELKEIEFDYRTGKISEGDYEQMVQDRKAEAVAILKAVEEATPEKDDIDAAIEERLRRKARPVPEKEKTPAAGFCTRCGQRAIREAKFCSACGAKL